LPEAREWFKANLGKNVEGYHLLDDEKVVGLVYYALSENALIPYEVEPDVACIYCTEILTDYLHKGYGKMMLDYMKNDLKKQGFKGIMVVASDFKEWMHYELFQKQGFKIIKEQAPFKVMYFPQRQGVGVKLYAFERQSRSDPFQKLLLPRRRPHVSSNKRSCSRLR
jgi:N-acetylglutamate synthase-like GNAT family acetyltransferase